MGNEIDEAHLTNISASGIQFETQLQLQLNIQIRLLWNDEELGILSATLFLVREVVKPERKQFKHIYGAQYHNLQAEQKEKLIQLLKKLKIKEQQETLDKIQEASPEYLLEVASNGLIFLKKFLSGEQVKLPALVKALEHLADYEKIAFYSNNEIDNLIQRFSAHTFQCHVFTSLVPIIVKRIELKKTYLQSVTTLIDMMKNIEKESEQIVGRIRSFQGLDHSQDGSLQCIDESKNRLFYAKQDLLQIVYETFESRDGNVPEFETSLKVITAEYENSLEITKSSVFDLSSWGIIKKGKLPKVLVDEMIIDNRPIPGSFTVTNATFIVIFIGLVAIIAIIIEWLL